MSKKLKYHYKDYPEHTVWRAMKKRCYNITPYYKYYGGRGITVCKRWLNSFPNFLKDMGSRPSKRHSIDRINNNKGYSKSNCQWVTKSKQMLNRGAWGKVSLRGVSHHGKKFSVGIAIKGKRVYIGIYKTKEEAYYVYCKAYKELHGVLPPK